MKRILITLVVAFFSNTSSYGQLEVDLGEKLTSSETIDSKRAKKTLIIKNMCVNGDYKYSYDIKVEKNEIPPFDLGALADADDCNIDAVAIDFNKNFISKLTLEKDESKISDRKEQIVNQIERMKKLDATKYKDCILYAESLMDETISSKPILFDFGANQTITIIVKRAFKNSESKPDTITWTKVFKTEEKSPWLIHYGLTYAPSAISRVSKYYAFADTNSVNKYTITKGNKHGPKAWDNISATINFTYPFHSDSRNFDGGFTGGFGLSTGFEVSGHAGLSLIIGQNIIVSSGVVMMQKYNLNGEYKEGQVIKTNLNFEALHSKVWVPELFFTIGFRFGSNPFAAKKTSTDTAKEEDN